MIKKIEIQNYKSIDKLDFELGRLNVFIGENGCGKTNILEAVAFAASYKDLDNSKLTLKGVRPGEQQSYFSGFKLDNDKKGIYVILSDEGSYFVHFIFRTTGSHYSKWHMAGSKIQGRNSAREEDTAELSGWEYLMTGINIPIADFIIYCPENYFLRNLNIDHPYIQPLGTKGEGLLKLVKVMKKEKPEQYKEIIENLHLIDWFSDIEISEDGLSGTEFKINDIYLEEGIGGFDIRNANEGFFLLLFYITLFVSDYTPAFFAIDNIDTALNPKLCTKLMEVLVKLAKMHNKQVLVTAHNPAILDGINLNDPEQRLFVVARNNDGHTRTRRIEKKPTLDGGEPMKMSEQFLRGYIGGLPNNF